MIEFIHQCDVPSGAPGAKPRRYPVGALAPEADISPDWLEGALAHGFCRRVEAEPAEAVAAEAVAAEPVEAAS